jgi:hypothetical protein
MADVQLYVLVIDGRERVKQLSAEDAEAWKKAGVKVTKVGDRGK